MASFSIQLFKPQKPRKDGLLQIIINISAKGNSIIRTGIYILKEHWDKEKCRINATHFDAKYLNSLLARKVADVENAFKLSHLQRRSDITSVELKKLIDNGFEHFEQILDEEKNALFFKFAEQTLQTVKKERTREIHKATIGKLIAYCNQKNINQKTLRFKDIDIPFIKHFEYFLHEQGLSVNTRSIHLRNLRKIYNDAIDSNKASLEVYPFRRFSIKHEKTAKRNIKVEKLVELRDYACKQHQIQYRDMFFLGFYLIGINMIDLCNLKHTSVLDGRIEYRREKTGRLYSIKIEPEALTLIEKYAGKNYLLNILDKYENYEDYLHRLNLNLQKIGKVTIGNHAKKTYIPLFEKISWYYARHSWATIASSLDISKDTIAAALGHGQNTITDIYIDYEQNKIDQANRKIIDYINNFKQ